MLHSGHITGDNGFSAPRILHFTDCIEKQTAEISFKMARGVVLHDMII